jgi:WD40 repeat protein
MFVATFKTAVVLAVVTLLGFAAAMVPGSTSTETAPPRPAGSRVTPGDAPILSLDWTPQGEVVAVMDPHRGGESNLIVHQPDNPYAELACVPGATHVRSVISLPWGRFLAGSADNRVIRWDHERWTPLTAARSEDGQQIQRLISLDPSRIVVGRRMQIELIDPSGRSLWPAPIFASLRSLSSTADGRLVAIGTNNHQILVVDAASGQTVQTIPTRMDGSVVAITPGGRQLLAGSPDGSLTLWDVATGEVVWIRSCGDAPITDLRLSPDGTRFAVAGDNVSIWNLCGDLLETIAVRRPSCVRFSPEGDRVAFGTWDGILTVQKLRATAAVVSGTDLPRL